MCGQVLSACIEQEEVAKGTQLIADADAAGCRLELDSLNTLLGLSKTTAEATALFQRIAVVGHEPDGQSYQMLVEVACRCGDSSLAVRGLRQMAKRGLPPTRSLLTQALERTTSIDREPSQS